MAVMNKRSNKTKKEDGPNMGPRNDETTTEVEGEMQQKTKVNIT